MDGEMVNNIIDAVPRFASEAGCLPVLFAGSRTNTPSRRRLCLLLYTLYHIVEGSLWNEKCAKLIRWITSDLISSTTKNKYKWFRIGQSRILNPISRNYSISLLPEQSYNIFFSKRNAPLNWMRIRCRQTTWEPPVTYLNLKGATKTIVVSFLERMFFILGNSFTALLQPIDV